MRARTDRITHHHTLEIAGDPFDIGNGIKLSPAATGSAPTISVVGDDTNAALTITPKGSGKITLTDGTDATKKVTLDVSSVTTATTRAWVFPDAADTFVGRTGTQTLTNKTLTSPTLTTPDIGVATGTSLAATGAITSSSATAGVGYATGAGGTITQTSSRTSTVIINKTTGAITLVSAAGSATPATFTVTNSAVAATDVIVLNQKSGTDKLELFVTAVAAGSFAITFFTTGGTTTETPVISFAVIKGVAA